MCNAEQVINSVVTNKDIAYLDSACTSHYCNIDAACDNIKTVENDVEDLLPNGDNIVSKTSANLPIQGLTSTGTNARLFEDIRINLISIRQLCDDDCVVLFPKKKATVFKFNKVILTTHRNFANMRATNRKFGVADEKTTSKHGQKKWFTSVGSYTGRRQNSKKLRRHHQEQAQTKLLVLVVQSK